MNRSECYIDLDGGLIGESLFPFPLTSFGQDRMAVGRSAWS
jgi:hypothetical protein